MRISLLAWTKREQLSSSWAPWVAIIGRDGGIKFDVDWAEERRTGIGGDVDTLFYLLLVIQPVTLLLHHLNFFRLGCNFPLMVDFPIYIRWSLGIFYRCMDRDQSKSIASGRAHNLIKLGFVTNSLLVVRLLVASQDQFPCLNFYWLAGPVEMDWESVGRGLR